MTSFEQVNRSDAWVLESSALEEGHRIEVGGLYGRMSLANTEAARRSLAKFVELSRRNLGQTLESLAAKAQVDLGELLAIETGQGAVHAQTIYRLAGFLQVNPQPLLRLAGLLPAQSDDLDQAALHFAVRAEPVKPLDPQEREALEKFRQEALVP